MRKSVMIFSLVAITLVASATNAFAQGFRIGAGRGGISIGVGSGRGFDRGYYNSGYGNPGYYNSGYGNSGYYNSGYGNRGYYNSGYNVAPGIYYSTQPSYYVEPSTVIVPRDVRQSSYVDANIANISVRVPTADAQVWFDNAPTTQRGMERTFYTPSLQPGSYSYTIRARWTENGRTVDQERRTQVQPGQSLTIDFRNSSETLPTPRPPQ